MTAAGAISGGRSETSPRWIVQPANARYGAIFLIVGAVEFLVGMTIAQVGYGPSYSVSQNLLSDLGVTSCGIVDSTGRYACSPWFLAFDAATILLGFLVVYGAVWVRRAFPVGQLSTIGLGLLALHGIGLIGAGFTPENVNDSVHTVFALLAFGCGAGALLVLGLAIRERALWEGYSPYFVASGLISAGALVLFADGAYLGLGLGGMERLVVAPILLWFAVVGVHIARVPRAALATAPQGVGT